MTKNNGSNQKIGQEGLIEMMIDATNEMPLQDAIDANPKAEKELRLLFEKNKKAATDFYKESTGREFNMWENL